MGSLLRVARTAGLILASALATLSCGEGLPSLAVDAQVSPTSLEAIALSGRAPKAASVEISRSAPEEAAGLWTVPVSSFDQRWRLDLELAEESENSFTAVPIDADGRRGEAVDIVVLHEAVRAHGLTLAFDPEVISTSAGAVSVHVRVSHPEAVELGGLPVEIFVGTGADPRAVLETDSLGRAVTLIQGLFSPGDVRVVARSGQASAEGLVEVVRDPFAPAAVEVTLDAGAAGELIGGAYHVRAGTEVEVGVRVLDASGEVLDGVPVDIESGAPGSRYEAGKLVGLTAAGEFVVVAAVRGSNVSGGAPLVVAPGEPETLELSLSHTSILVGELLRFRIDPRDAHGNAAGGDAVIEISAGPGGAVTRDDSLTGSISFDRTGVMEVVAALGELSARRSVAVGEFGDVAASVALLDPAHGTIFDGGAPITLRVQGEATAGVAEILLDVHGAGGLRESFRRPVPGGPLLFEETFVYQPQSVVDVLRLTATLVDRQGRRITEKTKRVLVHPSIVLGEGYELRYVAGGPGGGLARPTGIQVMDASTALVANWANQEVVSVELGSGEITPFGDVSASPRDIVRDPATGHLIVSMNNDRLARLDGSGSMIAAEWAEVTAPWAMVVDDEGLLIVVSGSARELLAFPASDTQGPNASFALGCGGLWEGDVRGVAMAPSVGGTRSLLATSSSSSALYRCESDANGRDDGRNLGSGLLGLARYVVAPDATSALVTNEWDHVVARLFEDPQDPAAPWLSELVATGFNYPFGLAILEPGRVLLTVVDDHLLLELRLP